MTRSSRAGKVGSGCRRKVVCAVLTSLESSLNCDCGSSCSHQLSFSFSRFRSLQAEPKWTPGCDWALPPFSGPSRNSSLPSFIYLTSVSILRLCPIASSETLIISLTHRPSCWSSTLLTSYQSSLEKEGVCYRAQLLREKESNNNGILMLQPCGWQGLGAPARWQAWASEAGELSSGHWTTRDLLAPCNINQPELSQRSLSQC